MHKIAPDPTVGAYSTPPDPLAGLAVGTQGKGGRGKRTRRKGRGGEGMRLEGVPECPYPELASLRGNL